MTSVLAGLGLVALLTTGSAQATVPAPRGTGGCIFPPPQGYGFVDFQGPVHQVHERWLPAWKVWQITINGRTYELNLGNDKTDKLKDGMVVRVTGRLLREVRDQWVHTMEYPPRPRPPLYAWVVMAETLEPIKQQNPPSFARITVRGKLNLSARLGYPVQNLKTVTNNGQTVVLDLGIMTGLGLLKLEAVAGKVVEIEGEITGFHRVTAMRVEDQEELPIMHVRKITPAR
jgi:hypothetical protein